MSTLPAAGVRAIDPGPFRLRHEPVAVPEGTGLREVELDRRLRPFGTGVNVPLAARLARGLRGGFQFDREDSRSKRWYPQGIDARGGIVLVSWYSKEDGAARLSVADTRRARYGHVALVADGTPVRTHAGGLAWREQLLYVADTAGGLRLFDLTRFASATLPQAGWYRPAGAKLRFSYASVDETAGALLVGEYLDRQPGARLVRWPFAPGGLLAQDAPSDAWVTGHSNLQGAVVVGGRMLMAASNGKTLPGRLSAAPFAERASRRRWATGCEDLASAGDEVLTVTEHPDFPRPLPRRRAVLRAAPP